MASRHGTRPRTDESEQDLRELTVSDLRDRAREAGIEGVSHLRKEELIKRLLDGGPDGGRSGSPGGRERDPDGQGSGETDGRGSGEPGDAGPDGGRTRWGRDSSKSLRYSQEVTSPDDEPERPGRSLVTTSHEVIRQWAEARGAIPATVEGTEHGSTLGALRFMFGGDDDSQLRPVDWDEWFATFDSRRLNFIYQEERSDGAESNFFRLENPEREDG